MYKDCKDQMGNLLEKCNNEIICKTEGITYDIDWSSSLSLHNWMEEMDMICWPNYQIGMFGTMYFMGFAISGVLLQFIGQFDR